MLFALQNKYFRSSEALKLNLEGVLEPVLVTFDMMGVGCAIVSRTRQLILTNEAMDRLNLNLFPGWLRSREEDTDRYITEAFDRAGSMARRVSRKLPELGYRMVIHRLNGDKNANIFLVTFHPIGAGAGPLPSCRFSPVEVEILECISQGYNLRETSEMIKIPYNTLRKYVQNLLEKASCRTQAHLVARYVGEKRELALSEKDLDSLLNMPSRQKH